MKSNHLKIAFILDGFPVLSETFILNQITGLLGFGHKVEIYAYYQPSFSKAHPDVEKHHLLQRTFYPCASTNKPNHFIMPILSAIASFPKNRGMLFRSLKAHNRFKGALRLKMLPFCLKNFRKLDYDILHCHFGPNGNLGVLVKKLGKLRGKVVTTFHGYDIRLVLKYGPNIYAPLRAAGDCYLSVSKFNRLHLERFNFDPRRIVDHPVGIDLDKFPFRPDRKPPAGNSHKRTEILSVARLTKEKGLEYGIRSIRKLVRKRPDLNLRYTIIGEGILGDRLKGLVAELGLKNTVRFLGKKDQNEVSKQMQKAHIFLLPSVAEALPVVLMEAQAVGLPVVATDVGSVAEIVADEKSGLLFPARNVTAAAAGLDYLIGHPRLLSEMSKHGRRLVEENHDINKLNHRLVNIFNELLGGGIRAIN